MITVHQRYGILGLCDIIHNRNLTMESDIISLSSPCTPCRRKKPLLFYFVNFGKNWPVFIFFTIEFRKDLRKKLELKLTSCQATSVSWVFICLFAFFLPDTHVLVTLLRYIVCCVSHAFHYEDKRLAQHWTTHNRRIHWPVACTTQRMNMWRRQTFKHMW